MLIVAHAILAGAGQTLAFLWDSLFGLIFGFLISAVVRVVLTPADMQRYLGPNVRGVVFGAAFGIISSACSYGASAAARGFYQRGADARSVFSFLISSTNMNVAILILFWSLLGWRFVFAEFFGGIVIIAVVTTGFTVLFKPESLDRLQNAYRIGDIADTVVTECPVCEMEGEAEFAVEYAGRTFYACGARHQREIAANPEPYAARTSSAPAVGGWRALAHASTWRLVADAAWNDFSMLRNELIVGYVLAGFAAALVPQAWLAGALHAVGSVPYVGYVLLLAVGLLIAVLTFVCSMGNVPVARFLANAGIPLGANTAFIYGDLLVPPLIAIYRKSFPPKVAWTFVALFTLGAMLAGAVMGAAIGGAFGGMSMGSMTVNDRITLAGNVLGLAALAGVVIAARRTPRTA